jgi:hypothetical protein
MEHLMRMQLAYDLAHVAGFSWLMQKNPNEIKM